MKRLAVAVIVAASAALVGGSSCGNGTPTGGDGGGSFSLSQAALEDPASCKGCHPNHVQQWSGSMHAYASDDPVFLAMNARGQRETNGALGSFCVNCHAPMAVRTGATKDGLNLASLPPAMHGVTCYFCHSITEVKGAHDAPVTLASDGVMRAAIKDPVKNAAHAAGYEALLDRSQPDSASLCGSCHDIVTPVGAHIERTYAEWQGSVFSHPPATLACGECHTEGRQGVAASLGGVPLREVHDHSFPGVDVALTAFPEAAAQQAAVQASLDTVVQTALCVRGGGVGEVKVVLDDVGAGHAWPSGATQDRRAWVELVAQSAGATVYQSGVVPDGGVVTKLADPDLWLIRDCMFDAGGAEVPMFWQAASYEANQLPGPVTTNQLDPNYYLTHVYRGFPRATSTPSTITPYPDTVTVRVRIQPVGLDVLDDLIASGDLDASVRANMPTFSLKGTELTWTADTATIKYLDQGVPWSCVASGLTSGANTAKPAAEHTRCGP